jgi:hypothetical protein
MLSQDSTIKTKAQDWFKNLILEKGSIIKNALKKV